MGRGGEEGCGEGNAISPVGNKQTLDTKPRVAMSMHSNAFWPLSCVRMGGVLTKSQCTCNQNAKHSLEFVLAHAYVCGLVFLFSQDRRNKKKQ